jgi:hypothetical protein
MSSMCPEACAACRHFNGQPLDIEAALPGLSSLSSAYAAVRSDDGICALHDRYVTASSLCAGYAPGARCATRRFTAAGFPGVRRPADAV